ncbi:MAG: competence/damage-inducible protein A [Flavicella sp.]
MKAEIITIGDEILIGQIVDTNSQWMGQQLNKIGVSVYQVTSIQDDKEHILKALKEAETRVDIVLITGGLGPTKDDITKHTLATYFEDHLILNEGVVAHVKSMFDKRGIPFSELNRLQGMVPSRCTVLENKLGTAPGMFFKENSTLFFSMPGVPYEMKGLMTESVLPILKDTFDLPFILHQTLITYGKGESAVAEMLESWEESLADELKFAYLPAPGKLRLRITAIGKDKELLEDKIKNAVSSLQEILGDLIVGFEASESVEVQVASMLKEHHATLALAESCTGGLLSSALVANAGASQFFKGGVVAYSESIKREQLGVCQSLIDKHSVVSCEVAEAMAMGVQKKLMSDFSIATTGNAGPTKDITDKTVGVVCIAIASPNGIISKEFNFGTPRTKVLERTVNKAFEMLRKEILKNYQK